MARKMEKAQFEKNNALRRRYYITASIKKADFKKCRRWLDHKADLQISTDGDHATIILNETAIQRTPRSRELFGAQTTQRDIR